MTTVHQIGNNRKRSLQYPLFALFVLGLAVGIIASGCGSTKYVTLTPTKEAKQTFQKVDMNPDDYAFFTTGPDATPEAVLLVDNQYLGEFDSAGWKLRDKQLIMDMLKAISQKKARVY